jgi:hypothetical protein
MLDMSGGTGSDGGTGFECGTGFDGGAGLAGSSGPSLMDHLLGGFPAGQPLALALGLAMARRAADILQRHRDVHARPAPREGSPEEAQFALDDAVFCAVLDAANDCLGQFDPRPPEDRWCDALLHVLGMARSADRMMPGSAAPHAGVAAWPMRTAGPAGDPEVMSKRSERGGAR